MKVKVGINGYGTIGKRVAWAVMKQPDMELVGVVKTRPDWEVLSAVKMGLKLFTLKDRVRDFHEFGVEVHGTVEDLIRSVDVVIDATPEDVGKTYKPLYEALGRKAIFQGGEEEDVAEVSFNALVNYSEALGKKFVRVVSCNTTGLLRVIHALSRVSKVRSVRGVIVRRGADLKEVKKGPIEGLVLNPPKPPSHHALDVKTVIKDLDIITYAVVAPTTLAHIHTLYVRLSQPATKEAVIDALNATPRILLVNGKILKSTAELRELARDLGRPNGDIYENVVWEDSVWVNNDEVMLTYAVHQEAIVVPENVDAVRAVTSLVKDPLESIKITDETLGIKRWL
ncbi:MAG: type II glyceraldehyde-3-phosphate dehydrogenase [Zestosphaera tikiterensis]|uniref:Glyceraldehyde-3-phosphate dehydrogenase n=1 Tax=Zestosphaera tikiterensis TaxID=1973259 RepID=A0A2R7Y7R6_9CREN|nr:MAG: type II glyceraldehyde-3-phosphate dehydrogenase [Zestosphaera tikiterensis]